MPAVAAYLLTTCHITFSVMPSPHITVAKLTFESAFTPINDRFAWPSRGRDADHSAPPAQIRTGAASAYGSCLGLWSQTAPWDRDEVRVAGESSGPAAD